MKPEDQTNQKQQQMKPKQQSRTLWQWMKLPFVLIYHFLFFPANGFMRLITWTPLLFIMLFIGSWAAWGLGYARYYYDGQPRDWETNARQRYAMNVVSNINYSTRRNANNHQFIGLEVNQPEVVFLRQAKQRGWWRERTKGENDFYLLDSDIELEWKVNDETITRFGFTMLGFNDDTLPNFHTRMRNRYGKAKVIQDYLDETNRYGVLNVWWTNHEILIVRWSDEIVKEYRAPEKRLTIEIIGSKDPEFENLMTEYQELHKFQIENDPVYASDADKTPVIQRPQRVPQLLRAPINQ